jgi:hypothetical protein
MILAKASRSAANFWAMLKGTSRTRQAGTGYLTRFKLLSDADSRAVWLYLESILRPLRIAC